MGIKELSFVSKDIQEILGNELANEVEEYIRYYPFRIQELLY